MSNEWAAYINLAVTVAVTAGLAGLGIDRWVHGRERSETGLSSRIDGVEKERRAKSEADEALRLARETSMDLRLRSIEKWLVDLETRANDHGLRLRNAELHVAEVQAVVQIRKALGG